MTEKEAFIYRELDDHGDYLSRLFLASIKNKKIRDKGLLEQEIRNVAYRVDESRNALVFNFATYGRFIEINWHKRAILRRRVNAEMKRDFWGQKKALKKPDRRWYAHNAYGSLNRLIGRISWGYTEEIAAQLREELTGSSHVQYNTHKGL